MSTLKQNLKLKMKQYKNAVFVPRGDKDSSMGLYEESGNFISCSGKRIYGSSEYSEGKKLERNDLTSLGKIDDPVIFGGYLRGHYGHFLIDEISRFWWIIEHKEWLDRKVVICINGEKLPSFYYETFQLMGISNICIVTENTILKEVLVPEFSYVPEHYICDLYQKTFWEIMKQVPDEKECEKIYLSRRHFARKHHSIEMGERVVEDIYKKNGYKIIYPEELSMTEQLSYYKSCKVLVSTNGSLAHNILWCSVSTKQVILKRFDEHNLHQMAIEELRENKAFKIDCFVKGSSHAESCYNITDEFKDYMKKENIKYSSTHIANFMNRILFEVIVVLKKVYRLMLSRKDI